MKKNLILLIILISKIGLAQTTYTFKGNGNWTIASNWNNNTIPPSTLTTGSVINIGSAIGDSCVLNTTQSILPGATLNIMSGANFIIRGGILYNPAIDDSILLSKIILVDTTLVSPNDTISILEYTYDINKRVTKTKLTEYYKTDDEDSVVLYYFYSGNDTLPFKMLADGHRLHYRSYDASARLLKDSINISFDVGSPEEPEQTNYFTYYSDRIVIHRIVYFFGPSESYDTVVHITTNGNISEQLSTLTANDFTFEFDTHPNPMYKIKDNLNPDGPIYSGDSTFAIGQQQNNYTEIRDPSGGHDEYLYQYGYKANAYPAYFRQYHILAGLPVYAGTGIYKYTQ